MAEPFVSLHLGEHTRSRVFRAAPSPTTEDAPRSLSREDSDALLQPGRVRSHLY
jgi:hypothetical protein